MKLRLAHASVVALLVAGCSINSTAAGTSAQKAGPAASPALVYVALGASETAGIGTDDPAREAYPQQLTAKLGRGAVLYNLGIPAETTAAALSDELPEALAVKPAVATVFFNVDDLVAGVSAPDFESRLDRIVGALRASGQVRVLIANTPSIDRLPAAAACQAGSAACPIKGVVVPPLAEVRALVEAYNAAIARVANRYGASVIDLSGAALFGDHPEYLSSDGFHPSRLGAGALAQALYAAFLTAKG